jgi:hypothetical protein
MDYKASTDMTVKVLSIGVTILFGFIIYRVLAFQSKAPLIFYGTISIISIIYFASFGLCTWAYRTDEKSLTIVAPFYNKTFSKEDIQTAELVDSGKLGSMIRTMGNGGLFGYYGWYNSSNIGSFFYYGTQRKNRILIQMKNGEKYIITPDDTSLLSELQPK